MVNYCDKSLSQSAVDSPQSSVYSRKESMDWYSPLLNHGHSFSHSESLILLVSFSHSKLLPNHISSPLPPAFAVKLSFCGVNLLLSSPLSIPVTPLLRHILNLTKRYPPSLKNIATVGKLSHRERVKRSSSDCRRQLYRDEHREKCH